MNGLPNTLQNSRVLVACDLGDVDPIKRITPTIDWAGFAERDLVFVIQKTDRVIGLSEEGTFEVPLKLPLVNNTSCNSADFILIGKDGSAKKTWMKTVPIEALFSTIDAMPMRRFEMRQKRKNN